MREDSGAKGRRDFARGADVGARCARRKVDAQRERATRKASVAAIPRSVRRKLSAMELSVGTILGEGRIHGAVRGRDRYAA